MRKTQQLVIVTGLFFVVLFLAINVQAAGFDCQKATTKIEKMICADVELSKLDEELTVAYKTAIQSREVLTSYLAHHQIEYIQKTQKEWLKKRNKCADKACVKQAYENRIQKLTAQKSWYAHCSDLQPARNCGDQSGIGYTVCEAYLKYLNSLDKMPVCEVVVPPGFQRPDWEELDVMENIDLAYQAEIIAQGDYGWFKKKYPDAATWKKKFLEKIKAGTIEPVMKKTKIKLTAGRIAGVYYADVEEIEILAYTQSEKGCLDIVEGYHGRTSWTRPGYTYSRITGNSGKPLAEIGGWYQTVMLLYKGKPYLIRMYDSGADGPSNLSIRTFKPFLPSWPTDQKYDVKEQCRFNTIN